MMIPTDDPAAVALRLAVHGGDLGTIGSLLAGHPALARASFVAPDGGSGTSLHMVTDWPGYFPNGPEVVELLISAGADPDVPTAGPKDGFTETPLHWAASSDDADVAAALVDGGADLEASGGSIAGSTPLANAVGYGFRLMSRRGQADLWYLEGAQALHPHRAAAARVKQTRRPGGRRRGDRRRPCREQAQRPAFLPGVRHRRRRRTRLHGDGVGGRRVPAGHAGRQSPLLSSRAVPLLSEAADLDRLPGR